MRIEDHVQSARESKLTSELEYISHLGITYVLEA